MKNVLITGGAGYIGSHMVKIAYQAGHDVITIDNLSTGHKDSVLHGKFEFCDINHSDELNRIFKRHKPDAVMPTENSVWPLSSSPPPKL